MSVTVSDVFPALRVVGVLSINALDSLPLPILIVIFLAFLALHRNASPISSAEIPRTVPIFYPALDATGRPQYFPSVQVHDSSLRVGRRGSKQREWKSGLDVVDEMDETERAQA
ncbi:MAG: hypothetical protein TREMPRED_005872 [Tremellales sp. Tagirdzhanova-0007]|nr:MAG: hypothetical protein TREMPRED_005872 [Tremellales sp. Tagirdzhanova-0007]